MKDSVLLELANRLERDASDPKCEDGAIEAQIPNAVAKGRREGMRQSADAIRMLIELLGENT